MRKLRAENYPNVTRDKYTYRDRRSKQPRAILFGVLIWCPGCGTFKQASEVGLRTDAKGILRNQNNCTACRPQDA